MSSVYKLEISDADGAKVFKFAGDLVINHIDKMVEEVKSALASPSDVNVVVDNPDNIDMTFLQLVASIRRSCSDAGKKFQISSTLKDDLRDLVKKAGLTADLNL